MKDIKPGALWGLCQILRLGISRCPALQLLEHNFPAQRQTIREHTETQLVSKHTQTHRQGAQAHTHKLYTSPPKKTLASIQQEHTHTDTNTSCPVQRHRHTAEQDPQRRAFRAHTCPGPRVDNLFTTRRKRSSRKPPVGVL